MTEYERKGTVARRLRLFVSLILLTTRGALPVELLAPPSIQDTVTNAVVRWWTDVAAGTRIKITPSGPRLTVAKGKEPSKEHAVLIEGLQPGDSYTIVIGTARAWLATNTFIAGAEIPRSAPATLPTAARAPPERRIIPPPARETWGNLSTLPDHFTRHGGDFQAKNAEEYARLAWEFLERGRREGLPAKVDDRKTLRVFDPKSGAFAAYNADGTTKTFFKPQSQNYFERQPGKRVDLKTWR